MASLAHGVVARALAQLVEQGERDALHALVSDLAGYLRGRFAARETEGFFEVVVAEAQSRAPSRARLGLTVGDLMSRVVHTADVGDLIRDAHAVMRVCRIRHLPVVDAAGQLAGILSDRDVYLGWSRGHDGRVEEVMSRHIHYARPATPAREAAGRMLERKIGCLPVLDDAGRLCGIITETDFLALAHRALTLEEALTNSGSTT
jgi:CBS domain-containing membrane protein